MKAQSVAEIMAGEARSPADLEMIASVMVNRAQLAGVPVEDVAKAPGQFDAYGKALPKGVTEKDVAKAQAILDRVVKDGVPAQYKDAIGYARDYATGNLPSSWQPTGVVTPDKHVVFSDPTGGAIATTQGYVQPASAPSGGMAALAPHGLLGEGSTNISYAHPERGAWDRGLTPEARASIIAMKEMNPDTGISITSARRSAMENARAKGAARYSQHLIGNAYDMDLSGLTDAERAQRVAQERALGAKRMISYDNEPNMLHVDFAKGFPPNVGGVYAMHNKTAGQLSGAPDWMKAGLTSPLGALAEQAGGVTLGMAGMLGLDGRPAQDPYRDAIAAAKAAGMPSVAMAPLSDAPRAPSVPSVPQSAAPSLASILNPISSASAAEMPQVASLSPDAVMARIAGVDVTPQVASTEQEAQRLERDMGMYQPQGRVEPSLVTADRGPRHMTPGEFGLQMGMRSVDVPAVTGYEHIAPFTPQREQIAPLAQEHLAPLAPQLEHLTPAPSLPEHLVPTLDTSTLYDRPPPVDPNYSIPSAPPAAPVASPTQIGAVPPPGQVVSPVGAIPAPPVDNYPTAPPEPTKMRKAWEAVKPAVKDALTGLQYGGIPGAIAGGLLGAFAPDGFNLGPQFDNVVPSADRFSTGFGLSGITAAMNGPFGATGFSLSNPGMSYTSLGPRVGTGATGLRHSGKYGWTETVGPGGEVRGIHFDNPYGGGFIGDISRSIGGFLGGKPTKAEHDYADHHAGLY